MSLLSLMLGGAFVTVQVTLLSALVGFPTGFAIGIARISSIRLIAAIAMVYVELFRGISALVLVFFIYYALPFVGMQLTPLWAGVIAFGIISGAYSSEVVRGAILGVDPGQREAALSLNMSSWQTMRRIILPQALGPMLPPFGNQVVELLKATSLLSLITLTELSFAGGLSIAAHGQLRETYLVVLIMYFLLAFPFARIAQLLERRQARGMDIGRGRNV